MTEQPHTRVEELPDRYFNKPVYDPETGDIERLERDLEVDEVVINSPNGDTEWDRIDAEEFTEDMWIPIPQPVIDNPVGFINSVLDDEPNPLGVVGDLSVDIGLQYARSQTEIVPTTD